MIYCSFFILYNMLPENQFLPGDLVQYSNHINGKPLVNIGIFIQEDPIRLPTGKNSSIAIAKVLFPQGISMVLLRHIQTIQSE